MKEVYILAVRQAEPVPLETLRGAFESSDVEVAVDDLGRYFSIRAGEARTDIHFESLDGPLDLETDFLTGTEDAQALLKGARGFYRISIEPGRPQPSVAVFEALWCVRTLMEQAGEGVLLDLTAFKLHDAADVEEITELDFDIRDHVNLHAIAVEESTTPLWVHSHGMDKFGVPDLEVFQLAEEDLPPAESFLQQLCLDIAFGNSPPLRTAVEAGEDAFMLVPADEARASLMGISPEAWEGHEGRYLTVLSASGRHNVTRLLAPYRDQFEEEPEEVSAALLAQAQQLLPAFKARFLRKGLMEPTSFRIRAPFESHPEDEAIEEDLWVEVLSWDHEAVIGKLVDGGAHTTEWRKGAQVRVDESSINAIALFRDGHALDDEQLRAALSSERPS
ncbi:MAG TPA: hypothetical protein VE618_08315 [Myxococcaceae bacterium]|nr:hypothetical protein [Myxococcaceae bacterium]